MAEDVKYTLSLNDLLTGKLREADAQANKLESSMSGIQSILGALGVAGGIAGIVAFGKSIVDAGTKVEDARVGLTTLLKDGNEAGKVITQTMEDATKTPFAFEGLLGANKALISAGESATGARETVLNLANAIAATGGGDDELQRMVVNLQQIKNTGKATALDIKQFAYAGINVYKVLADATGQPIEKVKDMEVSYDMLTMALKKAHEQGGAYYNGLENMAGNTSVQISNLGDAMFQLSVKIFDDLKPGIDSVVSGLKGMIDGLRTGWDWLVKNKDEITATVVGLTSAFASYLTITKGVVVWETLKYTWMMRSVIAESLLTTAQWALNAAMTANPIGLIVVGIGALAAGIYYAWQKSETFRGAILGLWEVTKLFAHSVTDLFGGMWDVFFGSSWDEKKAGLDRITGAFEDFGGKARDAFSNGFADGKGTVGVSEIYGDAQTPTFGAGGAEAKKGKAVVPGATSEASKPSKAQPNKAITVNISIGKLIEQMKIETTNMTDGSSRIREMVADAILSAVNQASLHAEI